MLCLHCNKAKSPGKLCPYCGHNHKVTFTLGRWYEKCVTEVHETIPCYMFLFRIDDQHSFLMLDGRIYAHSNPDSVVKTEVLAEAAEPRIRFDEAYHKYTMFKERLVKLSLLS